MVIVTHGKWDNWTMCKPENCDLGYSRPILPMNWIKFVQITIFEWSLDEFSSNSLENILDNRRPQHKSDAEGRQVILWSSEHICIKHSDHGCWQHLRIYMCIDKIKNQWGKFCADLVNKWAPVEGKINLYIDKRSDCT